MKTNDDLIAKLRAIRVPSREEVLARDSTSSEFLLDHCAADDGIPREQDEWFDYWADQAGREMASMGDLYQGFKTLKEMVAHDVDGADDLLEGLREDMGIHVDSYLHLVSSTRIVYTHLKRARIIHHYGTVPRRNFFDFEEVLGYTYTPLHDVLATDAGYQLLCALLDTKDDPTTIMDVLGFVSGKTKNRIVFRTPPIHSAAGRFNEHAVGGFRYKDGKFIVDAKSSLLSDNLSRGVRQEYL